MCKNIVEPVKPQTTIWRVRIGYIRHFFFFENRTFYEIMCKNIVEPVKPQTTIWRIRIACWITKATDTYSEYVILIATMVA